MDIGAFYPQYRQFSFARSRLRCSRSPWNLFVRGAREKQILCETTLLAHFECVRCIEVELVYTRERQNIDIHMQRKNTAAVKILPSTSIACFFCPHVKIPVLSVPDPKVYICNYIKAKLAPLLSDPNFIAGCVVQLDTCHCSTNPLAAGKAWRTSEGKMQTCVRVAFVCGSTHLKMMNFMLISKSQTNEFCDFLTHGNERQFSVAPSLINKSIN